MEAETHQTGDMGQSVFVHGGLPVDFTALPGAFAALLCEYLDTHQ